MIRIAYEFCDFLREHNVFGWEYIYKACKLYLNIFYPMLYKNKKEIGIDTKSEVIVSLSSFPKRINNVWITIETIMQQTKRPKKIVLWLAEDSFPNKEGDLPEKLLRLKSRGLEIEFCEDLWPHKKYFFAMKKYPDDIIITVDDDVLYPNNMIEELWKIHQKYPHAICCERGHIVTYTKDGFFEKYNNWNSEVKGLMEPTMQLFPIGCGGVLYPPRLLNEKLFDKEEIKRLCLANDDIWLKNMEVMNGVPAVRARATTLIYFDILGTRKSALAIENAYGCRNDKIMKDVCDNYPHFLKNMYEDWIDNGDKQ